tara:strand:+ start:152 stop:577 length:426 start_codon:yes stop_codon:yes gene_type:complete
MNRLTQTINLDRVKTETEKSFPSVEKQLKKHSQILESLVPGGHDYWCDTDFFLLWCFPMYEKSCRKYYHDEEIAITEVTTTEERYQMNDLMEDMLTALLDIDRMGLSLKCSTVQTIISTFKDVFITKRFESEKKLCEDNRL